MDLLVEKLDGSRYYLSQYKVLITDFEESAPSVTRNSKQLDQRNGNIDFGGWHTDKTINITGYYRADDIDEEETLREKLYALLSDPDGYYITQLKTTPSLAMERPGETSGGYYDKLSNYPSHKRFLVYTEAPEIELVGNVNGTLLYKLTAEFKTIKLPYGESVPHDLDIKPNVPYIGRNLLAGIDRTIHQAPGWFQWITNIPKKFIKVGESLCFSVFINNAPHAGELVKGNAYCIMRAIDISGNTLLEKIGNGINFDADGISQVSFVVPNSTDHVSLFIISNVMSANAYYGYPKVEFGTVATPYSPAPEDPDYNKWYFDTYYNTDNLFIPYAGTVPCNQLEQGFSIEMTAKGASSSLSLKIDDTELTYSGGVASGDVFLFTGFSYTQNGLSIVSKTNKAYFVLQPDKPNRITCNVPGTVRILGFQNLYA
ncbi:phage tail domain-containing protein [Lacticaseibacillus paracasei]|uniref:phage tail domain-containing protein n=1 Tax=Lacticaseibacillus paracasei TaxID=1597 RepID=UPI0031D40AA0